MQLPNELIVVINAIVLFLVVNGLKALSELIGKDLSGWGTVVAGVLAATFVFFLNQILALVPAGQQALIAAIFNVLILLLGAMGLKRLEVKSLRGLLR